MLLLNADRYYFNFDEIHMTKSVQFSNSIKYNIIKSVSSFKYFVTFKI